MRRSVPSICPGLPALALSIVNRLRPLRAIVGVVRPRPDRPRHPPPFDRGHRRQQDGRPQSRASRAERDKRSPGSPRPPRECECATAAVDAVAQETDLGMHDRRREISA